MKLKTLLTTLSFVFVFSQSVFAVESEEAKIANNRLKLKALNSCHSCVLISVNLYKANLKGANLFYAILIEANLRGADLFYANLTGADLTGADLTGANLLEANLIGANLTGADLTNTTLRDAKIEGAIFCNTKTPWGLDNSGCE